MKVEGISHVTIMVKDLDQAMEFFSSSLGIEFVELKDPHVQAAGVRCSMSLDHQLELLSPSFPLKDSTPPFIRGLANNLENREGFLAALTFRVRDVEKTVVDAKREGIRVNARIDVAQSDTLSLRNYKELITNEEDTLGIQMAFVEYERSSK